MGGGLGPGTPIGKYVVKRKLAEGGMAEIYLASVQGPEGFEKEVVIKRVRGFLATDPSFVQMFIAEARLASRLNHANIVQIFDFDRYEDTFYLAMEYVRGRSLWDVRRKSRERMVPMPPVLVAHIGLEVARGLHYAHRLSDRGSPLHLVHRDVTPHNVLLSWEGAIKLTDFGIAKAGNKLTSPGMLKGKFAYMSPEQARGENVDARTDVFALGVVLWEMLTGGRLFEGDSDVAVLRAVQQSVIAPPGRLNADVAPDLDAVVMKALARDPEERWQTAQELERALAHFILRNAQTVDETDLGAFLRALYADELAGDGLDGSAAGVVNPLAPEAPQPAAPPNATPSPSRREPTAVMPGSRGSGSRPPQRPTPTPSAPAAPASGTPTPGPGYAPDEDPHASTFVPRRDPAAAEPQATPIPLGTPKYVPPGAMGVRDGSNASPPDADAQPGFGGSPEPMSLLPAAATSPEPAWATGASTSAEVASEKHGTATTQALASVKPKRRAGLVAGIGAVVALAAVAGLVLVPRGEPVVPMDPPPDAPTPIVAIAEEVKAGDDDRERSEPDAGAPDAGLEVGVVQVDAGLLDARQPLTAHTAPKGRRDAGTPLPPTPPTPVTAESLPVSNGIIRVRARPWAELTIDGVKHGEISVETDFPVPAGRRSIEFVHPRRSQSFTILVKPGAVQSVEFVVDLN